MYHSILTPDQGPTPARAVRSFESSRFDLRRWLFVLCFVAGSLTGGDLWAEDAPAAQRPNIVVILADDMGYGDVQALNPESKIPTPNLDRIASEGMTFLDGHSPSSVCTPTRYGLLTGRYCWRTRLKRGVLGGYSAPLLLPGRSTIGNMLQRADYYTGAVGKWHLGMQLPMHSAAEKGATANRQRWDGDPGVDFAGVIVDSPIHHGFDEYFGVSASLDMAPYVYIRNDRFVAQPKLQQPSVAFPHFVRKGPRSEDFVIDEVLDRLAKEAVAFVDRAAQQQQPFFLYLPLTAPHKPTQPHPRFRGRTGLGEYGDFIAQVDDAVGQVLQALDDQNLAQQTLVVYTSDNGSYMHRYEDLTTPDHVDDPKRQGYRADRHRANGPFRGTKADIWEAGHHVPLLIRWPAQVAPQTVCNEPVCLTDLYATFAQIVGSKIGQLEAEDSVSLVPMLRGEATGRGVPVVHHSASGMFAVRDGSWKLVLGNGSGGRQQPKGKPFGKPYQLYDLSQDVAEERNLAGEHPEVVARLRDQLLQMLAAGRSVDHR